MKTVNLEELLNYVIKNAHKIICFEINQGIIDLYLKTEHPWGERKSFKIVGERYDDILNKG